MAVETNVTVQFVGDTTAFAASVAQIKEELTALGATKLNVLEGAASSVAPVITALDKVKAEIAEINSTAVKVKIIDERAASRPIKIWLTDIEGADTYAGALAKVGAEIEALNLKAAEFANVKVFEGGQEITDTGERIGMVAKEFGAATLSIEEATAAMAAWRAESGLSAQPGFGATNLASDVRGVSRLPGPETFETGGENLPRQYTKGGRGKTAADFAPATKEMREASLAAGIAGDEADKAADGVKKIAAAAEEAGPKIKSFGSMMREVRMDLFGVLLVAGAVKYALDQAASVETGKMHLGNILGDSATTDKTIEGLKKVSDQTNYSVASLEEEAGKLAAAGVAPDALTTSLGGLAATARATGGDLGEIVDVYDRMRLHGEVTAREMTRLTMASGGATRALAEQFSHLKGDVEAAKTAIEQAAKSEAEAFKVTEHHTESVNSLEEKLGLTAAVFKAWQTNMNQDSLRETPGFHGTAIQAMGTKEIEQFKLGIKEISDELGISQGDVAQFVKTGQLGFSDLLAGAKRYRDALQEVKQEAARAAEIKVVQQGQADQNAIFDKVTTAITNMQASEEGIAAYQKTFGGQMDQQMTQLNETIAAAATPIIHNFKAVEVAVGLAAAAFVAMKAVQFVQWGMELAGSMGTAQKAIEGVTTATEALTAAQAAKGGAGVAEGAASTATTTVETTAAGAAGGVVSALGGMAAIASVAAIVAIPIGAAFLAKWLADHSGNQFKDKDGNLKDPTSLATDDDPRDPDNQKALADTRKIAAGVPLDQPRDPGTIASDSTGFGIDGLPQSTSANAPKTAKEWAERELHKWDTPEQKQAAQLAKEQAETAARVKARVDAATAAAAKSDTRSDLEKSTGVTGIYVNEQGYEVIPEPTRPATNQYKPTGGAGVGGSASTFQEMYHQEYLQSIGNNKPIVSPEYQPQWKAPPPMQNEQPQTSAGSTSGGTDPTLAPLAKIEEHTAYLKDLVQMLQVA